MALRILVMAFATWLMVALVSFVLTGDPTQMMPGALLGSQLVYMWHVERREAERAAR